MIHVFSVTKNVANESIKKFENVLAVTLVTFKKN